MDGLSDPPRPQGKKTREKLATGSRRPSQLVTLTKKVMLIARVWRHLPYGLQNAREWQDERMRHGGVVLYGFAVAMVVAVTLKAKAELVSA